MRQVLSALIISLGLVIGGSFAGGRYTLVAVNGGSVARIDRVTGDVQSCQLTAGPKCTWADGASSYEDPAQFEANYPIVLPIPSSSAAPDPAK